MGEVLWIPSGSTGSQEGLILWFDSVSPGHRYANAVCVLVKETLSPVAHGHHSGSRKPFPAHWPALPHPGYRQELGWLVVRANRGEGGLGPCILH